MSTEFSGATAPGTGSLRPKGCTLATKRRSKKTTALVATKTTARKTGGRVPAAPRKNAPRKQEAFPPLARDTVRLLTDTGEGFLIDYSRDQGRKDAQRFAMDWAYVVRNRSRWARREESQEAIAAQILARFEEFSVGQEQIESIARAKIVEVAIPYEQEKMGWEARILPWEAALGAATNAIGYRWSTTVVRHLRREEKIKERTDGLRVLMVGSCPGRLAERFSFEAERSLVKTSLDLKDGNLDFEYLPDPSVQELEEWIRENSPHVIHLSGLDAHQGAELLDDPRDPHRFDGFYLADEKGEEVSVNAEPLARILNAGRDQTPRLVVFNTYYSAGRLAALAVAEGAGAALGYQDEIDDPLAELFLADFYRGWRMSDDVWSAFDVAWRSLRRQPKRLRGSGVVLWTEISMTEVPERATDLEERMENERREPFVLKKGQALRDVVEVEILPPKRLNYALLHNDRNLFDWFGLIRKDHRVIRDVEVKVDLQVGADHFPYHATFDIDSNPKLIHDAVRVPLTWDYVRGLKESVRTTLFIQVGRGNDIIHQQTRPVDLQPVEEWEDTTEHRIWLPSFVLPRDPAVEEVVRRARRYLAVLADDPGAGFDGYQSVDAGAEDPGEPVDLQVRAVWSALLEYDLGYVNPPPSYSYTTQRLRTPSAVIETRHGTCIDLTLLLAGCLEYVEIFPAIFLLKGHAFPAYWRTEDAYSKFKSMKQVEQSIGPIEPETQQVDNVHRPAEWMIAGAQSHTAILNSVRSDELVPVESVAMTQQLGLADAVDQGLENLDARDEFEFLVDIPLARMDYQVTPLPF